MDHPVLRRQEAVLYSSEFCILHSEGLASSKQWKHFYFVLGAGKHKKCDSALVMGYLQCIDLSL